jgi:hypothetical protein
VRLVAWFGIPQVLVVLAGCFCFAVGIWDEDADRYNSKMLLGVVLFSIGMCWHYLSELVNYWGGWWDGLQNLAALLVFVVLLLWFGSLFVRAI